MCTMVFAIGRGGCFHGLPSALTILGRTKTAYYFGFFAAAHDANVGEMNQDYTS